MFVLNAWHVIKKIQTTSTNHPHFTDLTLRRSKVTAHDFSFSLLLFGFKYITFTSCVVYRFDAWLKCTTTSTGTIIIINHKWFEKANVWERIANWIVKKNEKKSSWIKSQSNASILWLRCLFGSFYRSTFQFISICCCCWNATATTRTLRYISSNVSSLSTPLRWCSSSRSIATFHLLRTLSAFHTFSVCVCYIFFSFFYV